MVRTPYAATRLVLVRPADSRNVGAACRAAKTMGVQQLFLVGAERVDPAHARITAVHASDLIDEAQYFSSVADAIRGCTLVAAVTRRSGKRRKYRVSTPEEFGRQVASGGGEIGIVFGNERDGLTDAEVEPCHIAVAIPSAPAFPSLNLSHAVQIVAYEIFKQSPAAQVRSANDQDERSLFPRRPNRLPLGDQQPRAGHPRLGNRRFRAGQTPVAAARIDQLVAPLTSALGGVGFFSSAGAASVRRFLVDILARANIVDREAHRLGRILANVAGVVAGSESTGRPCPANLTKHQAERPDC